MKVDTATPLLVGAVEAARMLGIGATLFWSMNWSG